MAMQWPPVIFGSANLNLSCTYVHLGSREYVEKKKLEKRKHFCFGGGVAKPGKLLHPEVPPTYLIAVSNCVYVASIMYVHVKMVRINSLF